MAADDLVIQGAKASAATVLSHITKSSDVDIDGQMDGLPW